MASPNNLRIAVLRPQNPSTSVFHEVDDYVCTPAHYFSSSEASRFAFDHITIRKESSYATLRRLATHGKYDVFFNLCDGALDEDRAGEDVVLALERLNVPFTGSDSKHYEISKPDMKMIAYSHSIKVAGDVHFTTLPTRSELEKMVQDLSLPLLVKHPSGYGSVGIQKSSKCDNYESLWSKVQEFFGMYQCVMIEEFISGDEATVFVVEAPDGSAKVLNPVMMQFPVGETFKHFDLKWKDFEGMSWLPVKEDDPARDEIMRVGRIAFQEILGGIGTGRCDVRIDRTSNTVYFLEINANSGMFYPPGSEGSADWIMRTDPHFKHDVVATLMIESAIKRHEARQLPFKVTFDKVKGFHLTASRNLCKGTIIFHDEGKPLPVVTKPYVDKHWSDADKELFRRYAWPLSSDHHLYAIWQQDHTTWRPINHSCNPNVVFGQNYSLNCIAHRDILCGEELTMDYATMLDSEMMPFDCHCGAEQCRKHIHADPEVSKKYGENRWARW